jgi:8-oxo-dGTP pyrophosphatase MutT (NUDIX family)
MSFADRIRACNNFDRSQVVPLVAEAGRFGWLRHENAAALAPYSRVFKVETDQVRLIAQGNADSLSAAVDEAVEALVAEKRVPKWRNETFDVMPRWGDPVLFRLDRGAVPFFGVRAYGVHLNGYRRIGGELHLWIGRRAADKRVSPNKLDNMVAGGIGNGHGVTDTLFKEGEEEAAIPHAVMRNAIPVGAVSYRMQGELGIRDDVMFVYDLELPADFTPRNTDGEIAQFQLLPVAEILDRVRHTDEFKFNVNLVIVDFAMRHGLIAVDDAEYLDVANGLHRPLD